MRAVCSGLPEWCVSACSDKGLGFTLLDTYEVMVAANDLRPSLSIFSFPGLIDGGFAAGLSDSRSPRQLIPLG